MVSHILQLFEQFYKKASVSEPLASSSTTEGLPVAPSMGPALHFALMGPHATAIDARVLDFCRLPFSATWSRRCNPSAST